ncbi:MAG: RsmD family RNA methyltransferase [Verrucomicrobia bacterium]|nr:RsmD family RNA methyltransferase [Verrucomicrobiota bacterium]
MRIIGGTAAGLLLKAPKGLEVRPTPDLVKQALFNSLGVRVVDARILELFAGTGALGLECLSRGAQELTAVELAGRQARLIRENLAATRLEASRFELRIQDAFTALNQLAAESRQFDLVLADPPYGEKNLGRRSDSFAQQLLDDPQLPRIIAPGGLFILGHARRDTLSFPAVWQEVKMLKHGDSIMRFLKPIPSPVT